MKILALIVTLFFISLNISFLLSQKFFILNYGENKDAIKILQYVLSKDVKIDFLTYNEISHLNDVRNLVKYVILIRDFCLIVLIFTFSYFHIDKKNYEFFKILKNGVLILFLSTSLLLIFILINFDEIFIIFHEIFFPQGNWAFDASSELIILFPREFWIKQFLIFIGMSFLEFIFFYFFYIQNKNKKSINNDKNRRNNDKKYRIIFKKYSN